MKTIEHNKLDAIKDKSQACGEFLDWLLNEKKFVLARFNVHDELYPETVSIQKLLAEFFGIDQEKLEGEKRTMLDQIRKSAQSRSSVP